MPQMCLKRPVLLQKQVREVDWNTYSKEEESSSKKEQNMGSKWGKTIKGEVNTDQVFSYFVLP